MPETIRPYFEQSPAELERAFPDGSYFLGITAVHGFEPEILVVGIARYANRRLEDHGTSSKPIVLPRIYGDRLEEVLKDEFSDYLDNIYLSDELAQILQRTEFTPAGYQDHLNRVASNQEDVARSLQELLSKPFKATSLSGNEITIYPDQKAIELNTGANVTASEEAHFIFPIKLSDLLRYIESIPELSDTYDPDTLIRVRRIAAQIESKYKTAQITDHHSLTFSDTLKPDDVIFIPHLKDPKTPKQIIDVSNENGGIYMNVSGGGMGVAAAQVQARALAERGFAILAPGWMRLNYATPAGPDALYLRKPDGTSYIRAVVLRPGYGSIWNAIEAEIPMGLLPADKYESPEMMANESSIVSTRFGRVFSPRKDIIDLLLPSREHIRAYKRDMYERLGLPYGTSGLAVAADNIIKSELGK